MMKKGRCILFFIFTCFSALHGQIEMLPLSLNFGTTTPETEWVVDVHFTNNGAKKDYLLRHTFSHEYEVLFTSKTLMPDSSIVMRVKFSPRLKGEYKERIEIYFASMNEPVIIPVQAFVEYLNPSDHIPCPDFSKRVADCCPDNLFMLEVVDAEDGKAIVGAQIKILEEDVNRMKLLTSAEGKVSNKIPIGYYSIEVSHQEYEGSTIESYINHQKAYFKFRLKKTTEIEHSTPEVILAESPPIKGVEQDEMLLDADLYLPNNVVFLLDVSSSMLQGEKLALMKGALEELTDVLRSQDKITLISYADEAAVLLPTTSGHQHSIIKEIVRKLEADGATSGAKGFKASYDILKREFIQGGANNQLVVITDGAFQPADQKAIEKLAKKSSKKGIRTTIVGIQCASFANQKLSVVSEIGKGSFLSVMDESDLQVLIEELKRRSAK